MNRRRFFSLPAALAARRSDGVPVRAISRPFEIDSHAKRQTAVGMRSAAYAILAIRPPQALEGA